MSRNRKRAETKLPSKPEKTNQVAVQENPKVKSRVSGSVSEEFTNDLLAKVIATNSSFWEVNPKLRTEHIKKDLIMTEEILNGINPQDEIEGMLAAQMIAIHNATMECFTHAAPLKLGFAPIKGEYLNQANKLCRTYTGAMEALMRYRNKDIPQQKLIVEGVHVHDGGKAIVGNIHPKNKEMQTEE